MQELQELLLKHGVSREDYMKDPEQFCFDFILSGEKKHFCPEWDYMAIDETWPEFDVCTCYDAIEAGDISMVASVLPKDWNERKDTPLCSGVLDYFPLALAEVARVSKIGNDQHNPGQSLHWARGKSSDHADCIVRHLMDRGSLDVDGASHTAKVAWRALALLQEELEEATAKKLNVPQSQVSGRASKWPM